MLGAQLLSNHDFERELSLLEIMSLIGEAWSRVDTSVGTVVSALVKTASDQSVRQLLAAHSGKSGGKMDLGVKQEHTLAAALPLLNKQPHDYQPTEWKRMPVF